MKKILVLSVLALFVLGYSAPTFANTAASTQPKVQKEGLKQGLKNGAKKGAKDGLKNGPTQGLKDGAKNGAAQGMKYGLKDGLKNGLKNGQVNVSANNLTGFVLIPANRDIESFYIGQYPVTNSQYKEFVDNTGTKMPNYWKNGTYPNGKGNHPVIFVSYNDALAYCKWLKKQYPQYSFRLPTISEWEYAASGGKNYQFPWGNQINENNFNYNKLVASVYLKQNPTVTYNNPKSSNNGQSLPLNQIISLNQNGGVSGWIDHTNYTGFVYTDLFKKIMDNGGYTTPVNQYSNGKSPFGVYDMSGNVWEWTSSKIIATNGAEKGRTVYAIKGGSWYANPNSCKITMSGEGRHPNSGYNTVGFRVVATKK